MSIQWDYNIRCFSCGKVWLRSVIGAKRNCPYCGCPFIIAKTSWFK
jgi:rRNA maturation endonuclease Nob1